MWDKYGDYLLYATARCGKRTATLVVFVLRTTPRPSGTLRTLTYSVGCTAFNSDTVFYITDSPLLPFKSEADLISDLVQIVREFLLHLESFLNVIVYHFIVLKTYNTVADAL